MDANIFAAEFPDVRAGALTLLYLASPMEREVLHTLVTEMSTGVELQQVEPPSEEFLTMGIFEDPYLLEPADPDHGPDEPIGPRHQAAAYRGGPRAGLRRHRARTLAAPAPRRAAEARAGGRKLF